MRGMILELPLIGKCKIFFDNNDLFEYVKRQFKNYYIQDDKNDESNDGLVTRLIFLDRKVYEDFKKYSEEGVGLSRDGNWNNNEIQIGIYKYVLKDGFLEIQIAKSKSIKKALKELYQKMTSTTIEQKYALLGGHFYNWSFFPVISIYAACYGYYCLHGSLLNINNKRNIIITGLDGVGKSSLSDIICRDDGNKILADNIVLFDGEFALNLNLAMRLEVETPTESRVIYRNRHIKEILPSEIGMGACKVGKIVNLLRSNDLDIKVYSTRIPDAQFLLFLGGAPEVGQANSILSFWLFMYDLLNGGSMINIPITTISLPNGKLEFAKEIITQ